MGETRKSANARMACLDCGASSAEAYVTTKGENPGRPVRVCTKDFHRWEGYGLRERDLLPGEGTDTGLA